MPDAAHRKTDDPLDAATPPEIPDYTLLRRIGRGSYGDVWLARSVTGVFRVIKVVQRSRFEDDRPYLRELEGISRFQAAVSGRPRQLALLHVGRNDDAGYFYYVMEPADDAESGSAIDPDRYVPLTLREMVKRRGRLPASECVQFALELARGLAVLHGENLIHRDIKPSNVIFVQRVPKLADVGLVASADATLTGVGTPGYLPPEGPGSAAADVYSLGKVIYEMATGMDQSQYPRIPKELADHADAPLLREINGIILKACNPYPNERHTSVEALARDLELIQAGRSVVFYEEFRKRSRAILLITASLALIAGLAAALFVWRSEVLQRANNQSRRALYQSDVAIAQLAITSGDLGRARSALGRHTPTEGLEDLRGLEWAILARAVQGEGSPLEPITNPVAISEVAVDSAGRWVAAALIDDRVCVWDLRTGTIAKILSNARVLGGFLPDGRIVIDEPDRTIRYYRPDTDDSTTIPAGQRLYQLLPDGRMLVVTPDGDLVFRVIGPESTKIGGEFNLSSVDPSLVNSMQGLSPDGNTLVVGAYIDKGALRERLLIAVDLRTNEEIWRLKPHGRIVWVHWAPKGNLIAVNIGGMGVTLLNPKDGSTAHTLTGHTARVQDAKFTQDDQYIATASADQTVRVWDTSTGKLLSTHRGLGRPATSVAWLPSKQHIVACDDSGSIRVFPFPDNTAPDLVSDLFDDLHGDLAISPDARLIAVTKSTNQVSLISTDDCATILNIDNLFQPVSFSNNGSELYAFSSDWSLWQFNLASKSRRPVGLSLPPAFSVDSWTISPSGLQMAFSGNQGSMNFFDIAGRRSVNAQNPETNIVWAMTFTGDGKEIWAGSEGGRISRWDPYTGKSLGAVTSIEGDLQALSLSSDGRWLAASLFNDSSLRLWDRLKKQWLAPRYAHRRYIQSLIFTPASDRLVSGGVDGRIILWRVPEFEEIASFEVSPERKPHGDEGIAALRLAPSNAALAALTEDGRLQVWRAR